MSTVETDTQRNFEDEARFDELADREPQVIEREIDATRADMRATLEALERRFSVDRLMELTLGRVRERGGEFAGNLTEAAAQNPLPLLLVSIGVGWLMLANRSSSRQQYTGSESTSGTYGERMGSVGGRASGAVDKARGAVDKARGAVDSTRETLKHAADSSREALRHATQSSRQTLEHTRETLGHTAESLRSAASTARERAHYARDRVDRMLHEQPLMLGALGIAAGAIIGALVPMTQQEDRYLGEARNKAMKNVAEKSREAVKNVAEKSRALYETAREHEETSSSPGQSGDEQGTQRGQTAQRRH
jgi:ElaB/YqjD/DUF883 family membrane-anchored ribosome-binding protein